MAAAYQSFDEVLSAAAEVDDAAEDVGVVLTLELLKNSVSGDVDSRPTSAVTLRYVHASITQ